MVRKKNRENLAAEGKGSGERVLCAGSGQEALGCRGTEDEGKGKQDLRDRKTGTECGRVRVTEEKSK